MVMAFKQAEIDALLPLPPATFHILMAVADEDRHGYAIIQEVRERSDDHLQWTDGMLYPVLHRMEDYGWIESRWTP